MRAVKYSMCTNSMYIYKHNFRFINMLLYVYTHVHADIYTIKTIIKRAYMHTYGPHIQARNVLIVLIILYYIYMQVYNYYIIAYIKLTFVCRKANGNTRNSDNFICVLVFLYLIM